MQKVENHATTVQRKYSESASNNNKIIVRILLCAHLGWKACGLRCRKCLLQINMVYRPSLAFAKFTHNITFQQGLASRDFSGIIISNKTTVHYQCYHYYQMLISASKEAVALEINL
jgi:hypothetical protein